MEFAMLEAGTEAAYSALRHMGVSEDAAFAAFAAISAHVNDVIIRCQKAGDGLPTPEPGRWSTAASD